jgi:hypothetical protein
MRSNYARALLLSAEYAIAFSQSLDGIAPLSMGNGRTAESGDHIP